jgi:hypothetical protein
VLLNYRRALLGRDKLLGCRGTTQHCAVNWQWVFKGCGSCVSVWQPFLGCRLRVQPHHVADAWPSFGRVRTKGLEDRSGRCRDNLCTGSNACVYLLALPGAGSGGETRSAVLGHVLHATRRVDYSILCAEARRLRLWVS